MPTIADPGIVRIQVISISLAMDQPTAYGRSDAPIPIKAELVTWVVDTGAPKRAAVNMIPPAEIWPLTACSGRIL